MNKLVSFASAAALAVAVAFPAVAVAEEAAPAAAPAAAVEVTPGKMLYDAKGYRIAAIYRVNSEGSPQVIIDGRLLTVPASTLSEVNGKLTTSLSKRDVVRGG